MNTVKTFHLEDLCILEGKWKSTIGQLHCLEFPQSYYLPGLRNHRRISWADLFIFFPHAVPFPFTFGWTRSNPNVPFLPRWPNNPTLDIQPEPFSSFANFITAFKLMRSAEWTEKSISETLICVLFLVVLADWPRYCSKQKTMCAGKYYPMWKNPCLTYHVPCRRFQYVSSRCTIDSVTVSLFVFFIWCDK